MPIRTTEKLFLIFLFLRNPNFFFKYCERGSWSKDYFSSFAYRVFLNIWMRGNEKIQVLICISIRAWSKIVFVFAPRVNFLFVFGVFAPGVRLFWDFYIFKGRFFFNSLVLVNGPRFFWFFEIFGFLRNFEKNSMFLIGFRRLWKLICCFLFSLSDDREK